MQHFDLVIIGTGSGNMIVNSSFRDKNIAIVEKGKFGGTCLNMGCIPSKMLAYSANVADTVADASEFDVPVTDPPKLQWPAVRDRVFGKLDHNEAEGREGREQADNITVFAGTARFSGERQLHIDNNDGTRADLTADQIVIAAGGRPVIPPPIADSGVDYHTSNDIMRIDSAPEHLVILGGSYIASELAHVFAATGSKITIIEQQEHLLGPHDEDVTATFTELAAKRWTLHLGTAVVDAKQEGDTITVVLDNGDTVIGDALLVAAGRKPNSDLLDCAAGGIDVDGAGRVRVDEYQRATSPGVWALGDISSPIPLKHVANREAKVVAHNLLNPGSLQATRHEFCPSAVFTEPQIASVGKTEQELRSDGTAYTVGTKKFSDIAYGWAMQDTTGFCKVLADPKSGTILGAHILGPQAATLIHIFSNAMQFGISAKDLAEQPFWTHPALTEIVENALLELDLE